MSEVLAWLKREFESMASLLTYREAALIARRHERTIRRWVDAGRVLVSKPPGGAPRILKDSLLELLAGER